MTSTTASLRIETLVSFKNSISKALSISTILDSNKIIFVIESNAFIKLETAKSLSLVFTDMFYNTIGVNAQS